MKFTQITQFIQTIQFIQSIHYIQYTQLNQFTQFTHSCNLSPAPPAPLVYFFPAGVLFSTENTKGTTLNVPCHAIPKNRYAKQK